VNSREWDETKAIETRQLRTRFELLQNFIKEAIDFDWIFGVTNDDNKGDLQDGCVVGN
jgi:hypothetical protein